MGFLRSLQAGLASVTSAIGLDGEIAKLKNKDAAAASLAIVALVAGSDGEVEKSERKAGADFVRQGALFQAFDRPALASQLEGFYSKATDLILKEDLYDVIRKVRGTDAAASVVKVGIGIASADGEFEPQEKEVLIEVCKLLQLNPADFRGLS